MNVFAYRLPDETTPRIVECGEPQVGLPQDTGEYFVVHPFSPDSPVYCFPVKRTMECIPADVLALNSEGQPPASTSFEIYDLYIGAIREFIGDDLHRKVVASRRLTVDCRLHPQELFEKLCVSYPHAFVFFISCPMFGSWIGASPELLLARKGDVLSTVALAGTRPAGSRVPWDRKNLLEQAMVTEFIADNFARFAIPYHVGDLVSVAAGPVEHLQTSISAMMDASLPLDDLLLQLSPTPALSGYPRREAVDLILGIEKDSRQLYGGFMGMRTPDGDFRFNVVLRCAKLWPGAATLFAGGGITALSSSYDEWEETERKFSTLLSLFSNGV